MTSSLLPRWRRLDPESTSCIHLPWKASSRHAKWPQQSSMADVSKISLKIVVPATAF